MRIAATELLSPTDAREKTCLIIFEMRNAVDTPEKKQM